MVAFAPDEEVLTKMQPRPRTPLELPAPREGPANASCSSSKPPTLQQARSAPTLRRPDLPGEGEAKARQAEFRDGLDALLSQLDAQSMARRMEQRRAAEVQKAETAMRRHYQQSLDAARAPEKPDWTYPGDGGYFQVPVIDPGGPSVDSVKKPHVQSIYAAKEAGWKEQDKELRLFGAKPMSRMGATELKFARRLEERLSTTNALDKEHAKNMTSGAYRRHLVEASAGEHSCLKREKKAWQDQVLSTHVFFSVPEPSKPGDLAYDTSLKDFIERPARTMNYERDIVVGDPGRTSHWKPNASGLVGSAVRLGKAQALLCPPGFRGAQATAQPAG